MKSIITKHNALSRTSALFVAFLAIIGLTSCGQPATGPLSRGGDAARAELRRILDTYSQKEWSDTSALDALIILRTTGAGVIDSVPNLRIEAYLTNQEGFDVTPLVLLFSDTLRTKYAFGIMWPSAYADVTLHESSNPRLMLGFDNEDVAITPDPFPTLNFTNTNEANEAVFFHLVDSTVPYTSGEYADLVVCVADVYADSSYQPLIRVEWTQADNGALLLPAGVRANFSVDTWIQITISRMYYGVQITPSGKYIGVLRMNHVQNVIGPDE